METTQYSQTLFCEPRIKGEETELSPNFIIKILNKLCKYTKKNTFLFGRQEVMGEAEWKEKEIKCIYLMTVTLLLILIIGTEHETH